MSMSHAQDVAAEVFTTSESPVIETMIDTPAFLNSATDAQRKEYIELEGNPNLTLEMKQKALYNWAQRCGNPVNGLYTMYMAEKQTLQSQEDQRMSAIVAQLSPEAQQADKHVRGITSNLNQTKKEMDTNVAKQLNKLPKKVYYELTFATQ
ncbi:hypothetical protein CAEBREN_02416 [Caenorhabditis brenneri]|uniref:SXP/RAL-2 family protein Ani s 5-like cation-binding domain-containing protein n=1 Tax=Caenorhabditis brenneri TaxID=135651 RepID=G0NC99_CAEBE|nr:hypothetical protein CAEBREN_02416 [Caenorhabditis brenneri]